MVVDEEKETSRLVKESETRGRNDRKSRRNGNPRPTKQQPNKRYNHRHHHQAVTDWTVGRKRT